MDLFRNGAVAFIDWLDLLPIRLLTMTCNLPVRVDLFEHEIGDWIGCSGCRNGNCRMSVNIVYVHNRKHGAHRGACDDLGNLFNVRPSQRIGGN